MAAFVAQQARWVAGAGRVLRTLGRRVVGGAARPEERLGMLAHLLRHARQPLLVAMSLWLPARALGLLPVGAGAAVAWPLVLTGVTVAAGSYYAAARKRVGCSPLLAVALSPLILVLSVGLALPLSVAFVRGLLGAKLEFQRTPKSGGAGAAYQASGSRTAPWVVALGLFALLGAVAAGARGDLLSAAGLVFFVVLGPLWVGLGARTDAGRRFAGRAQ